MNPTRPGRTELCCESLDLRMPADNLDLHRLREQFARLFDRAAAGVQRSGYDLDDVIVDRFLICQAAPHQQADVPVEFLSRADHIRQQIARAFPNARAPDAPPPSVEIIALTVRAWLDRPA